MSNRGTCCWCHCGYRCGGPGKCKLDMMDCLRTNDGKHYVRDCGHDFSGPLVEIEPRCSSKVCQKCGLAAIHHDMMVGP